MKNTKKCSECGGSEIYQAVISSGGGHAPDMLPGAHPWWGGGKMEAYVCGRCGHYQFFVPNRILGEDQRDQEVQQVFVEDDDQSGFA